MVGDRTCNLRLQGECPTDWAIRSLGSNASEKMLMLVLRSDILVLRSDILVLRSDILGFQSSDNGMHYKRMKENFLIM